ncbi:MAG TPA: DUF883 family protein [Steroidobacteraceae bacterium]|jgi:ElaB/YqjD/DUF883 family membrane-anchored ribosome-binding protein
MSQTEVGTLRDDLQRLITHAEELLQATAHSDSEQVCNARRRAQESLSNFRSALATAQHDVLRPVRNADRNVHEKPWQYMALAGSAGLVVGLLMRRQ